MTSGRREPIPQLRQWTLRKRNEPSEIHQIAYEISRCDVNIFLDDIRKENSKNEFDGKEIQIAKRWQEEDAVPSRSEKLACPSPCRSRHRVARVWQRTVSSQVEYPEGCSHDSWTLGIPDCWQNRPVTAVSNHSLFPVFPCHENSVISISQTIRVSKLTFVRTDPITDISLSALFRNPSSRPTQDRESSIAETLSDSFIPDIRGEISVPLVFVNSCENSVWGSYWTFTLLVRTRRVTGRKLFGLKLLRKVVEHWRGQSCWQLAFSQGNGDYNCFC